MLPPESPIHPKLRQNARLLGILLAGFVAIEPRQRRARVESGMVRVTKPGLEGPPRRP